MLRLFIEKDYESEGRKRKKKTKRKKNKKKNRKHKNYDICGKLFIVSLVTIVNLITSAKHLGTFMSLERAQKRHKNWQLKQCIVPTHFSI